jgi:hypothetical protein
MSSLPVSDEKAPSSLPVSDKMQSVVIRKIQASCYLLSGCPTDVRGEFQARQEENDTFFQIGFNLGIRFSIEFIGQQQKCHFFTPE